MLGPCLNIFARNDGDPTLGLIMSFTYTAANIFGDWLMVYSLKIAEESAYGRLSEEELSAYIETAGKLNKYLREEIKKL